MNNLTYALQYSAKGWQIAPVVGNRCAAQPTENPEKIKASWEEHPHANIGVATGRASGLFVLEVDQVEGLEMLEALEAHYGEALDTLTADVGVSWQLYFAEANRVLRTRTILPGIKVYGEGSYVIAPPAPLGDGDQTCWTTPGQSISSAPSWLLDLISQNDLISRWLDPKMAA